MSTKTKWNPPETAPKTIMILACVGWPWPVVCHWDAEVKKWAYPMLNIETKNEKNEYLNVWWETEYADEKELRMWAEMPWLHERKKSMFPKLASGT